MMEKTFIYDEDTEFYLPEFYKKFKDKLPMLAIVISGHYGTTQWNDFNDGMVIRFHKVYEVKRVIARESSTLARLREQYLSIPVNSKHRFHRVLGKDKLGPEESMDEVLENGLPCLFRFSNYTHPRCITDKNTDLILLREYTQAFLLGNSFLEGSIQPGSVACFLCPHISVTPITGIKDKSEEEFQDYLDSLNKFVLETTTFCHTDCDLNVRQFYINDENYKGLIQSEDLSEKSEVKEYSDLAPELPPRRSTLTRKQDEHCYEKLLRSNRDVETLDPKDHNSFSNEQPTKSRESPKTSIKEKFISAIRSVKEKFIDDDANSNSDRYEGVSENCVANKITFESEKGSTRVGLSSNLEKREADDRSNRSQKTKSDGIEQLSVEDVTDILERLNLGRYSEQFAQQAVDGQLLQELDADILMSEFGLTPIEIKRLTLYIKKGYIPKTE